MGLGPSVVLCRSQVDTQLIVLLSRLVEFVLWQEKKQLSKEKRVAIITLRNGQSVRKIGKTLKVSPSAVTKTIKRYKETDSHTDRRRKGRPRVTSAAEDKFI